HGTASGAPYAECAASQEISSNSEGAPDRSKALEPPLSPTKPSKTGALTVRCEDPNAHVQANPEDRQGKVSTIRDSPVTIMRLWRPPGSLGERHKRTVSSAARQ